jgi:hypothetical protein
MIFSDFRLFVVFVLGGALISFAEDSKSFDGKNKTDTQQGIYANDKNSSQSQSSSFEGGKNFGDGKVESKAKEFDFQSESAYALIKDIKKYEPIGIIDHSAEKFPQTGLNKTRQFDGLGSSKSPFMSGALSGIGSYERVNKLYEGDGYNFSDRFQEGIRTELGEGVYEKAVWTYAEIKGVDNWINSTMAQYGFGEGSLLGKQKYSIVGLDGLLNVMVILQQGDGASLVSKDDGNALWQTEGSGDKAFLIEGNQDRLAIARVQDSKFSIIFKYLTIINLIYSFLGMVFVVVVVGVFRFLVRQQ